MNKCWIVGPIAWDWPYLVPDFPLSGQFAQAVARPGRLGGTGANVARALASRYVPVGMIGYVGRDTYGAQSTGDLQGRGIDVSGIEVLDGSTSQVLLFIEPTGERTIIGVVEDNLNEITIPVGAISRGDLVYFAGWRKEFELAAADIARAGAVIASVPFSPPALAVPVTYVIGSSSDLPADAQDAWPAYCSWTGGELKWLALTLGAGGANLVDEHRREQYAAIKADAVDATGAGDAFAAAMLAALVEGRPAVSGVRDGLVWGAATVQQEGSIPPPWNQVSEGSGPA